MREWSLLAAWPPSSVPPLPSPASSWPARTKAFNKCNTITCRTCLEEEQQQQQQWQRQRQQQQRRQPVGQRNNSIAWLTVTPDCRLPTPTLTADSRLQTPDSVEPSAVDFSELLIAPRALSVAFPLAPQIFKCCACDFSFRFATVAVAEAAASGPASALSPASAGKWSRWD